MSNWKTLRENELGNKCFHSPEWAHDEIVRLTAEVLQCFDSMRTLKELAFHEDQTIKLLKERIAILEAEVVRLATEKTKWIYKAVKAEMKQ